MYEFEPAFVAVPNPLWVKLALKGLSKGVEYLEENFVWNATDCCHGRHWQLMIVVTVVTVGK
jgi:hypothetical protein